MNTRWYIYRDSVCARYICLCAVSLGKGIVLEAAGRMAPLTEKYSWLFAEKEPHVIGVDMIRECIEVWCCQTDQCVVWEGKETAESCSFLRETLNKWRKRRRS